MRVIHNKRKFLISEIGQKVGRKERHRDLLKRCAAGQLQIFLVPAAITLPFVYNPVSGSAKPQLQLVLISNLDGSLSREVRLLGSRG